MAGRTLVPLHMNRWIQEGPYSTILRLLCSPKERELRLGPIVCLSVCLCLSDCLFVRHNFHVFHRNCLLDWDDIFTFGTSPHENVLMIIMTSSVTWYGSYVGKTEKKFDLCISETAPKKKLKLGTKQVLMGNECFFYDFIGAFVMTS